MKTDLLDRRFSRFLMVGGLATLTHVVVFVILVERAAFAAPIASIPAFLVAMLVSYALNRTWTFQAYSALHEELPRYAAVALVGLFLNYALTRFVVEVCGLWYGFALIAVVTLVPAITFTLNRTWTFGQPGTATSAVKK